MFNHIYESTILFQSDFTCTFPNKWFKISHKKTSNFFYHTSCFILINIIYWVIWKVFTFIINIILKWSTCGDNTGYKGKLTLLRFCKFCAILRMTLYKYTSFVFYLFIFCLAFISIHIQQGKYKISNFTMQWHN